jgi:cytochrome c553
MVSRSTIPLLITTLLAPILSHAAEDPNAFFESRIRPLLVNNCQQCHGEEKQKGNLRLDSREGWQRGGDSGPPITPGKPEASLLSKAISYTDRDLKMPPKKKLSDAQIADLQHWIKLGAPDPRDAPASITAHTRQKGLTVAEGKNFWSFKPPQPHKPPAVKNQSWPRNEIDHFILAKLEEKGLSPAPDAAPEVLRRRLAFDLTGLPPVEDGATIDSLLASPRFAERWSSHWLDIARFAESSGGGRTLPFKDAWRYRDYVIESFRDDVPVNRFLTEQLAGDLLPHASAAEQRRHITATGFLTLGATNYEEQDKMMLRMDIVDEQLDTIGKSFLGLTIGCARCHDHKFDPIPTRDYYALAGIFRSTRTLKNYTDNVAHWIDTALPLDGEAEVETQKAEKALTSLKDDIAKLKDQLRSAGADLRPKGSKPLTRSDLAGIVIDDADAMKIGDWKTSSRYKPYVGKGYSHDDNGGKGTKTMSFTPKIPATGKFEIRIAYNAGPDRAEKVAVTVFHADGEDLVTLNEHTESLEGMAFASLGTFRFEDSGQGYVLISNAGAEGYVTVDAVQFIPEDVADRASASTQTTKGKALKTKLADLEKQLKALEKTSPKRPEAMSVAEDTKPEDSPVHIRGSVRNLGAPVPRGFLQVALRGDAPAIPADQSGRLQFAQWLTSESNPLTARVYVNRVWHWLFGAGLVRTTENFGITGEAPSHPELLDYLALRFMRDGWSTKKLVKLIVSSRTYQQSSGGVDGGELIVDSKAPKRGASSGYQLSTINHQLNVDPDNRLLSRMNRKRLDAECIRDAMLAAAGTLEDKFGGPNMVSGKADANSAATQNLEYNFVYADTRRSLYTPAFRNVRHPLFEVFDFADVNQPIPQRTTSTVATQALFMTNSSFVIEQARAAAVKLLQDQTATTDTARIDRAYMVSLARAPTEKERATSLDFIEGSVSGNSTADDRRDIWARLIQAIWSTPEFRFLK